MPRQAPQGRWSPASRRPGHNLATRRAINPTAALALGDRFLPIRQLGRGGMGEVWLVRDRDDDKEVVAKFSEPDSSHLLEREFRMSSRLQHPHIVPVFNYFGDGAVPFFTMAYVNGPDIGRLRGSKPVELINLLLPIAGALGHTHSLGIVHHDVKIRNILVNDSGAWLIDFGIAGALKPSADELVLRGGGSRHGMSPQQRRQEPPQTADDIYALGVVLYELLNGHPPFDHKVPGEQIQGAAPPPLVSQHALPGSLVTLVTRMLENSPQDRPESMAVVEQEFRAIHAQLTTETSPPQMVHERVTRVELPPHATTIQPTIPGAGASAFGSDLEHRRRYRILSWLTAGVVAGLVVVAISVFVMLPGWADERRPERPPQDPTTPLPATPTTTSTANPEQADAALGKVLRLKRELEGIGVTTWGGEQYRRALEGIATADRHLRDGDYGAAVAGYDDAARSLRQVAERAGGLLQQAIADGQAAIASGDARGATEAFSLAAALEPHNRDAIAGLSRAAVLDRVLGLITSGEELERDGNDLAAVELYRQALDLDPKSPRAKRAFDRARARMVDASFRRAMSSGLESLRQGQNEDARGAFIRANKLRPGSVDSTEALARANSALTSETITRHRMSAESAEREERWGEAAADYEAVLGIDPTIAFAQRGRARARSRAELHRQLQFHIQNPSRLATRAVLDEAASLLGLAAEIESPGPRHREQLAALSTTIQSLRTPVSVTLRSDGKTELTVYRVGRLGVLLDKQLMLTPGTYTIVGSRRGYRDVRRTLEIGGNDPAVTVTVKCEERI